MIILVIFIICAVGVIMGVYLKNNTLMTISLFIQAILIVLDTLGSFFGGILSSNSHETVTAQNLLILLAVEILGVFMLAKILNKRNEELNNKGKDEVIS